MFGSRFHIVSYLALGLALVVAGRAEAGLLFTQAGASGETDDATGNSGTGSYQTYMKNFVNGRTFASATGSAFSTNSSAAVNLIGSDPGFHLYSLTHTSDITNYGNNTGRGQALAAGQWEDVIRMAGVSNPPGSILLNLHINGLIDFSVPAVRNWQEQAEVGITNTVVATDPGAQPTQAANTGGAGGPAVSEVRLAVGGGDLTPPPGSDPFTSHLAHNLVVNGDSYSWDANFLVDYDSNYGGYHFNLYASAFTDAIGFVDVTADFSHTFQLTSVTQADGSALTGPITFDSGFQFSSTVPEPSSLVLMGIGGITGLGYAWLHAAVRIGSGNGRSGNSRIRRHSSSSPLCRAASKAAKANTPVGDQLIPRCLQRPALSGRVPELLQASRPRFILRSASDDPSSGHDPG